MLGLLGSKIGGMGLSAYSPQSLNVSNQTLAGIPDPDYLVDGA
jgi:hypothetical protein